MALIKCPECAKEISDAATSCPSCGFPLRPNPQPQPQSQPIVVTPERKWSPGIAAVLSLVIPGAGQMYKGQVVSGIMWLLFVIIGYALYVIPGLVLHIFCIVGAASGDPTK